MFDPISSRAPLTLYLIWFIAQEESFPCTRQPSSDVPFKEKARQKLIVIVVVARCHQILYRNGAASGDLKCVTPPFARIYLCVYVCVCGCYLCAHAHCSPGAYTHTHGCGRIVFVYGARVTVSLILVAQFGTSANSAMTLLCSSWTQSTRKS